MPDWSGAVRAGVQDASLANTALEFSPATDPNTVAPHAPATPDKKSLRLIAIRNPQSKLERVQARTSACVEGHGLDRPPSEIPFHGRTSIAEQGSAVCRGTARAPLMAVDL